MSSRLLATVVFLISAGLYLVFAGQVSGTEIAAGIPAASLVAAYAGLRRRGESRPMRLRGPWLRLVLSPLASVAGDIARVGAQILHAVLVPGSRVAGVVSRQPFRSRRRCGAARRTSSPRHLAETRSVCGWAGGVATILLALVTFVFDQSSFIDIALCLALLTLPGTLVLALFLERWL